jgi:hypothetical protein
VKIGKSDIVVEVDKRDIGIGDPHTELGRLNLAEVNTPGAVTIVTDRRLARLTSESGAEVVDRAFSERLVS